MVKAAIDLGSNSVLLTVMNGEELIHDEARVVGLGRGLVDGGAFRDDRMQAALGALYDYATIAGELGVAPHRIRAIATSASRRARNATAFYERVENETGIRFRIVSGEEEARLTFLGSISGIRGDVAVVDLGGGSTEVAMGNGSLDWRHSFELGSVRLTEAVLGEDVRIATPDDVERMPSMARIEVPRSAPVVGVAGSVTTLAAAALGLRVWDAARVHGATLTLQRLVEFQQDLIGRDADQRKALFPVGTDRADFLLAGAVIVHRALLALGQEQLMVSVRGLRFGALAD